MMRNSLAAVRCWFGDAETGPSDTGADANFCANIVGACGQAIGEPNMMKRAVLPSLAAIAVALGAFVATAQEVPKLDVGPLCAAQAKASKDLADACRADEKKAQDELVRRWAEFAAADKARCSGMVRSVAGAQSYVELLTCLQIALDVKSLPKQ